MELYDVMRTTFSAREFTADPVPDEILFTILDRARFAPSGGNRQGWRVIVVRDRRTREGLAAATVPAAKRYAAQVQVGESPWNTIVPTKVDAATIERTPAPPRLIEPVLKAPVISPGISTWSAPARSRSTASLFSSPVITMIARGARRRRCRSARVRGTPSTALAWTRPPSSGPRRPRA